MGTPIKKPCFLAGSVRQSGAPQTAEVLTTRGGTNVSVVFSGSLLTNAALTQAPGAVQSGGHVLLMSGPGRLNTYVQHQNFLTLSGVAIAFYDSNAITASGVSFSGQKVLALLNAPGGASGQFTLAGPYPVDMPFANGLCVSAPSGTPGFSVSITPEITEPGPVY